MKRLNEKSAKRYYRLQLALLFTFTTLVLGLLVARELGNPSRATPEGLATVWAVLGLFWAGICVFVVTYGPDRELDPLRAIEAHGKLKGAVITRLPLCPWLWPFMRIQIESEDGKGARSTWCFALPAQLRGRKAGDRVDVVEAPSFVVRNRVRPWVTALLVSSCLHETQHGAGGLGPAPEGGPVSAEPGASSQAIREYKEAVRRLDALLARLRAQSLQFAGALAVQLGVSAVFGLEFLIVAPLVILYWLHVRTRFQGDIQGETLAFARRVVSLFPEATPERGQFVASVRATGKESKASALLLDAIGDVDAKSDGQSTDGEDIASKAGYGS